ncbi:MAG: hypothetical protein R3241_07370 [Rheinheimera sp.]|nr:hypothetical protein [Rheinheimera sp.]
MSAVKQSHVQQQRFFFQQQKTVDLTRQESKALNLVWAENNADAEDAEPHTIETAHCAVLGYN